MATEYILSNHGRPLNGDNFSAWKLRITSILTALNLKNYLDQNITTNEIQDPGEILRIQKENAAAVSIILNNIEDKIYPLITDTDTAHELMENLKILFEQDEDVTLQEWMNKLRDMKVKNHKEILSVTSKMMSIFKQMEKKKLPITEQEKIDYLLGCMPKELKIIFISGTTTTANDLYEDIKNKYKLLYHIGKNKEIRNTRSYDEDMMDIDLVNNIMKFNKGNNNNSRISKYCHICNMKNHNTSECGYNTKNKNRYNKYNNNSNNNRRKLYQNNKRNYNRNNINYLNKKEMDEILSNDGLAYINNINNKENNEKSSNSTTWIYDTGASEHITCNVEH